MPKAPRQLDSRIEIVTPENIAFHYVLAGPFRRLPAYLIDCAIRALVIFGLFILVLVAGFIGAGGWGFGVLFIAWFAMAWFYGGLFETFWNGQTPGKRIMGLRVLSVDGRPINGAQAVLRNLLRDIDAMPMVGFGSDAVVPLYTLALVVMTINSRFQRLGDLASSTIVVVERRSTLRELVPLRGSEVVRVAGEVPVSFVPRRAMAHALSVYAARRALFSSARRYEIARTLAEPLIARWQLPRSTDPDILLCALYYRTFIADRSGDGETTERAAALLEAGQT
jgi:uncharacterized RDD family membrane protein YckC